MGGVSRYASAALNPKDITYVFVGRTILPHGNENPKQVSQKSKEAAPWFAGLAIQVFEQLKNVWWIPDHAELEELRKLDSFSKLKPYLKNADNVLEWQGLSGRD